MWLCVHISVYNFSFVRFGRSVVRALVRSCARSLVARHESFKIKLHSNAFGCMATRARSFPFATAYANIHTFRRHRTNERTNDDHNVNPFTDVPESYVQRIALAVCGTTTKMLEMYLDSSFVAVVVAVVCGAFIVSGEAPMYM